MIHLRQGEGQGGGKYSGGHRVIQWGAGENASDMGQGGSDAIPPPPCCSSSQPSVSTHACTPLQIGRPTKPGIKRPPRGGAKMARKPARTSNIEAKRQQDPEVYKEVRVSALLVKQQMCDRGANWTGELTGIDTSRHLHV